MNRARRRRERFRQFVGRFRPRCGPATRDNFLGWVTLLLLGFVYLTVGRLIAGRDTQLDHGLALFVALWSAIGAGVLALLIQSHFDVAGRVSDWVARLRAVGLRLQADARDLLARERLAGSESQMRQENPTSEARRIESEIKLGLVRWSVNQDWKALVASVATEVNNVCREIEAVPFLLPTEVHHLRMLLLAVIHTETRSPQAFAWRNSRWAELSLYSHRAADSVAPLTKTGVAGAPRLCDEGGVQDPLALEDALKSLCERGKQSSSSLAELRQDFGAVLAAWSKSEH